MMPIGLLVLGGIFLLVVAPIWIVAHYLARWRAARGLSREDERRIGEMWELARRLEERIGSLERILDEDAPGWRARRET